MPMLESLTLFQISNKGVLSLSENETLSNMTYLEFLSQVRDIDEIMQSNYISNLQILLINGKVKLEHGSDHLVSVINSTAKSLECLEIHKANSCLNGFKLFYSDSQYFSNLNTLHLSMPSTISDLEYLAKSNILVNLRDLSVYNEGDEIDEEQVVDIDFVEILAKNETFKNLNRLGYYFSDDDIDYLWNNFNAETNETVLKLLRNIATDRILCEIIDNYLIKLENLTRIDCNFFEGKLNNIRVDEQCENLTELKFIPYNDKAAKMALSKYSKTIKKMELVYDYNYKNDYAIHGPFYSVFEKSNSFPNLKTLELIWNFTTSQTFTNWHMNLSNLAPTLENLTINTLSISNASRVIDPLLNCLSKLSNLATLQLNFKESLHVILTDMEILAKLHENLSLHSLTIGNFDCDDYIDIVKSFITKDLKKLSWNYGKNAIDNVEFECENLVELVVNGEDKSTNTFIRKQLESMKECKLEKLHSNNSCASLVDMLPQDTMKYLQLELNNGNIHHFSKLTNFSNLHSLILHVPEMINDYSQCKLPKFLLTIKFSGEITGMERGFSDMLLSAVNLQKLSFENSKLQDGFFEKIIPMSYQLDDLIVIYNTDLTLETIEHLKKFTNCRVLLWDCFSDSVLGSQFSIFCQETPKVCIIRKTQKMDKRNLLYPKLDYTKIDSVVSAVKERVKSQDMKEAYVIIIGLFHHFGNQIEDIPNLDEICKLFLKSYRYDSYLRDATSILPVINKMWNEKKIEFTKVEIGYLENISRRSSIAFCQFAPILLDLGYYSTVIETLSYLMLKNDIPDETSAIIERLFTDFISGEQDLTSFSGFDIVKIAKGALKHFIPAKKIMNSFIEFLIGHEFYKHSHKTIQVLKPSTETSPILEKDLEYFTNLFNRKEFILNEVLVKVPLLDQYLRNEEYTSTTFNALGYEWCIEFIPNPKYVLYSTKDSFKINLQQTKPETKQRGMVDIVMCNYDFEPQTYFSNSRKINWNGRVMSYHVKKKFLEPYSRNDDFLVYKFVVGLRNLQFEPIQDFNEEIIHNGRKDLSSTNYPSFIYTLANKFPTLIQTCVIRVCMKTHETWIFGDQFEVFGFKFALGIYMNEKSGGTTELLENKTLQDTIKLTLCSFDYNSISNNVCLVNLKAFSSNSDFLPESTRRKRIQLDNMYNSMMLPINGKYFKPRVVEMNGKSYLEYVINIGLSLRCFCKHFPTLYSEDPETLEAQKKEEQDIEDDQEVDQEDDDIEEPEEYFGEKEKESHQHGRQEDDQHYPTTVKTTKKEEEQDDTIWTIPFLICFVINLLGKLRSLLKSN
ncbi:predicted protein [Naegleria gruberi]|uniref:Predicted protein n=1 Tax=Naegleria gruberi TaxID=5762 RepID=D2VB26_NAEGR|nr:uncharacterized protein NAEGRDRAFT_48101 [Naegleria gruberi]EFC46181.1 predicted protein [Naegleria gruberi]|eukprot:XP_002678925.1 predicted protein [Naegleria gruberi strain NEG-M]